MAVRINSNIASLGAQRRLNEASSTLNKTFERLSSGQRINKASDDAAGLAVASSLNVSRRVFTQGIRNFNDGIGLIAIADSTIEGLSNISIRLRELAQQASNGTLSNFQRRALDDEAQALSKEFFRLSRTSNFNRLNLFDGSLQGIRFQGGYGLQGGVAGSVGGKLGTGQFSSSGVLVNAGLTSIDSADINADGYADIVSGATGSVTIRYGQAGGGFSSTATISTGSAGGTLALGDFDGNGTVDIAAANEQFFVVVSNNGNGTFSSGPTVSITATAIVDTLTNFTAADIDNDGRSDIIFGGAPVDASSTNFVILRGTGNGQFTQSDSLSVASGHLGGGGQAADGLRIGDIDSNGTLDMIFTTTINTGLQNDTNVYLYRGDGRGGFDDGNIVLSYSDVAAAYGDLAIGDINSDGNLDFVVSFSSGLAMSVDSYLGNGRGSFSLSQSYSSVTSANLELYDLNGDGALDIIEKRTGGGAIGVRLGGNNGSFGSFTQISASSDGGTSESGSSLLIADFNSDGVADIFDEFTGVFNATTRDGIQPIEPFSLRSFADARQSLVKFSQITDRLSLQRGQIGALQSRMETALRTLTSSADTIAQAESRIKDADIARESADLARVSIVRQFATSILAQANSQPQLALTLLQ